MLNFYYKNYKICFILFILIFSFGFWSKPVSSVNKSPDSNDYISLARDFNDPISRFRPIFFPIILRICMIFGDENWPYLLLLFQLFSHSLVTLICFYLFNIYRLSQLISVLLTLIIGFNPNIIYYSTYVLADFTLSILTTLVWFISIVLIKNKKLEKNIFPKKTLFIGLLCGILSITKPTAIFLFLPILFSFVVLKQKKIMSSFIIISLLNFLFLFTWEAYKGSKDSNLNFESMDHLSYSINMTSLRAGLIDYGVGTPFYNEIIKKNQIDEARAFNIKMSYTMDTQPRFMGFKQSFDKKYTYDKYFSKRILENAPYSFFLASISNWHSFFTKRCFGPGPTSFLGMPSIIRVLYFKFYSYLYRPFLLILLSFSFIFILKQKNYELFVISFLILLYVSLIIAILTPHGGEFPRYRVWVEYIMWFCALLPIGIISDRILIKFKRV